MGGSLILLDGRGSSGGVVEIFLSIDMKLGLEGGWRSGIELLRGGLPNRGFWGLDFSGTLSSWLDANMAAALAKFSGLTEKRVGPKPDLKVLGGGWG